MNVFYIDADPIKAARKHIWHKHVIKMIIEYAQLLSTCHHQLAENPPEGLYNQTHINHPSAVWVRQSRDHYYWVYDCMMELGRIYEEKRGREHLTITKMKELLREPPDELTGQDWTQPPQCMPEEYHDVDSEVAYNKYYEFKRELLK